MQSEIGRWTTRFSLLFGFLELPQDSESLSIALLGGLVQPEESLFDGGFGARAPTPLQEQDARLHLCMGVIALRRLALPLQRLGVGLLHAFPLEIHVGKE